MKGDIMGKITLLLVVNVCDTGGVLGAISKR